MIEQSDSDSTHRCQDVLPLTAEHAHVVSPEVAILLAGIWGLFGSANARGGTE